MGKEVRDRSVEVVGSFLRKPVSGVGEHLKFGVRYQFGQRDAVRDGNDLVVPAVQNQCSLIDLWELLLERDLRCARSVAKKD